MRLEPRSPHFGCQIRRTGAECSTGLDWVGNAFSLSARSSRSIFGDFSVLDTIGELHSREARCMRLALKLRAYRRDELSW